MPNELVKILVDIPDPDFEITGESLWAKSLGDDLYVVDNSPWHTLEINHKDIVRAIAPNDDSKPVFVEVVRRGGHRSIHIYFLEEGMGAKQEILTGVNTLSGTYEGKDGRLFAVDIEPAVNFDAIVDYLQPFEEKELIGVRYAPQPQPAGSEEIVN